MLREMTTSAVYLLVMKEEECSNPETKKKLLVFSENYNKLPLACTAGENIYQLFTELRRHRIVPGYAQHRRCERQS